MHAACAADITVVHDQREPLQNHTQWGANNVTAVAACLIRCGGMCVPMCATTLDGQSQSNAPVGDSCEHSCEQIGRSRIRARILCWYTGRLAGCAHMDSHVSLTDTVTLYRT